jgi:hypothetical protein
MKYGIVFATLLLISIVLIFLIVPFSIYLKRHTALDEKIFDFNFWSQLWIGFFSALLFTLFIFFVNERVVKEHDISGVWIMETEIHLSSTIPGFQLGYKLYLLKKGTEILGSGEKIYEVDSDRILKEFLPVNNSNIVLIQIEGHFGKRYLKGDIVKLVIREKGILRESLMILDLKFRNEKVLVGSFASTAASSYGNVVLKKVLI